MPISYDKEEGSVSTARVVATVIARGGGSTLYRKNAFPLLGKPSIQYALEILQATRFITDIFLWTEDAEIKAIGERTGVTVLDRPREMVHYASGFHTLEEWYHHRADQIINHIGILGDYEVGFNCNNILLRPATLEAMFAMLLDHADTCCRVQGVYKVPPCLCLENPITHGLFPFWNDPERHPGQHPPLYRMAGVTVNDRKKCSISTFKTRYYEIDAQECLDFQSHDDIILAEYHLSKRQSSA